MNIPITLADQIAELKAELAIRTTAYGRWIRDGRMKAETANKKFAAMRAALHTLIELERCVEVNKGVNVWPHDELARAREEEGLPAPR